MIHVTVRNPNNGNSHTIAAFDNAIDAEPTFLQAVKRGMAVCMYGVWDYDNPLAGQYLAQSALHKQIENKYCCFPD
jgi:hypothetical protein